MKKNKSLNGLKDNITLTFVKTETKIKNILNNERGDGGILIGLAFTALILIAVLAMKGSIDTGFASLGTWFSTTIVDKVKTALN